MQKNPKNKKDLDKWQNVLFYPSFLGYPVFLFFLLFYFKIEKISIFFNVVLFLKLIFFLPIILLFNSSSSEMDDLMKRLKKDGITYDEIIDKVIVQKDAKIRMQNLKTINDFYFRALLYATVQGLVYGVVVFSLGVLFLGSDFFAYFL